MPSATATAIVKYPATLSDESLRLCQEEENTVPTVVLQAQVVIRTCGLEYVVGYEFDD